MAAAQMDCVHQKSGGDNMTEFRRRAGPARPVDDYNGYQAQDAECESEREEGEGCRMQQTDFGRDESRTQTLTKYHAKTVSSQRCSDDLAGTLQRLR